MSSVDFLLDSILRFSILAFLLLAACMVGLRLIQQPIERIRSIQISLLCVFLATILSQVTWKPSVDLPVLPASESSSLAEHRESRLREAPVPIQAHSIEVGAERNLGDRASRSEASAIDMQTPAVRPRDWWNLTKRAIVIGFLGISLLQIAYLSFGYAATRRLIANSKPLATSAEMRVRRTLATLTDRNDIRFATSTRIEVPLVSGIIKPTILLPTNLVDEDADLLMLRHSLAHEWQHISRYDLVSWQLVTLCQVFLWPQPFYWALRRELRVSQDQIADDFAAQRIGQQAAYAETLVAFSRSRQVPVLGALTMAGTQSNLFRRVEMLLNDSFQVSVFTRKRVVFAFASAMIAAGVVLASLQLTQATAGGNEPDEKKSVEDDAEESKKGETLESVQHSGFVFDAKTNKPIDGATVIVTRMNSGDWRELQVTESTTDANGKYTFTIPPDQLKQRLLYIMFDLRHPAYAPRHCGSYGYAMIKKNLELGSEPWFNKLKMVPGSKISGRLVDENGKPIAGAHLRGRSSDPSAGDRVGSSWVEAVSDKDGRFEVQATRDGTAGLSFVPLDHCMKHLDIGSKRGDVGDIALSEGVSIRGRVLDARGKPMEGLWVNLTRVADDRTASYEMKRSSKTDDRGEFRTRPLSPGEYSVEVQMKATGAIEKAKYANFHDDPPPAMFVRQVIEVAGDESDKPFVIQAVPHVLISGQCYDSAGKERAFHSPYLMGRFNDQPLWIRAGRTTGKGAFELMVPHGVKNADLHFTTNEHSALTVQFDGKAATPQRHWRFETIEEDISEIRIVRYVAPILQVRVVNEAGDEAEDASVRATYAVERNAAGPRIGMSSYFERQGSGLYQSSSLAPDFEFDVYAAKDGLESDRTKLTMKEGENKVITLMLKKKPAEAKRDPIE